MQYQNSNNVFKNEKDSKKFAQELCELIKSSPFLICLYGDLGVGKTFICREIIQYFCGSEILVNSPTFNLLNIYTTNSLVLYHYDLYRLKTINEIYELSIEEALDNHLTLIEWPELIEDILPKTNRINIEMKHNNNVRFCNINYLM
jgi:tRNA threonylcarbamoyladenosine biosynthesis protein TsaE